MSLVAKASALTRAVATKSGRSANRSGPVTATRHSDTTPLAPVAGIADDSAPFRSLLRPLGIVGYDGIEPALLAALATEEPLLLVSDHGAAKSLLLERLARALGLELRHYNASLLQFDDLAGFPIPDERGGIRYAAPAGAVWEAEVVFLDEIGRCRPEVANKLFPIIHERRLQGLDLPRLRHRWAATNPPSATDEIGGESYLGVEPLDPALADRFTFVVPVPAWHTLSAVDRAAVVRGVGDVPSREACRTVQELVEATRALLPAVTRTVDDAVVSYVITLGDLLASAGVRIGGRRAASLRRAILATWAASLALGRSTGRTAVLAALSAALTDVARKPVSRAAIVAAHEAAWRSITLPPDDPQRILGDVTDPVRRAALAIQLPTLPALVRAEALTSALAALPAPQAAIVAWFLLPALSRCPELPATVHETVGAILEPYVVEDQTITGFRADSAWVTELRSTIARETLSAESANLLYNIAARHMPKHSSAGAHNPRHRHTQDLLELWRTCERAFAAEGA